MPLLLFDLGDWSIWIGGCLAVIGFPAGHRKVPGKDSRNSQAPPVEFILGQRRCFFLPDEATKAYPGGIPSGPLDSDVLIWHASCSANLAELSIHRPWFGRSDSTHGVLAKAVGMVTGLQVNGPVSTGRMEKDPGPIDWGQAGQLACHRAQV